MSHCPKCSYFTAFCCDRDRAYVRRSRLPRAPSRRNRCRWPRTPRRFFLKSQSRPTTVCKYTSPRSPAITFNARPRGPASTAWRMQRARRIVQRRTVAPRSTIRRRVRSGERVWSRSCRVRRAPGTNKSRAQQVSPSTNRRLAWVMSMARDLGCPSRKSATASEIIVFAPRSIDSTIPPAVERCPRRWLTGLSKTSRTRFQRVRSGTLRIERTPTTEPVFYRLFVHRLFGHRLVCRRSIRERASRPRWAPRWACR